MFILRCPVRYGTIIAIIGYGSCVFDFAADKPDIPARDVHPELRAHAGWLFVLQEDEHLVTDTLGKLTIAHGRFSKFVVNRKFRFKVSLNINDREQSDLDGWFTKIGLFSGDQWSVIIYEYAIDSYDMVFYFRRQSDAIMFKMRI